MTFKPYLLPISVKGIVFEDERVWLRKNERNEWELPGGKIDPGEQPKQTVKRELLEELGFNVSVNDLISADIYTINKSIDESYGVLVVCYRCELLSKTEVFEIIGEAGKAEFKLFSINEVDSLNMPSFYKNSIKKSYRG